MVRVCDAIMGTGKSSAAITYINEHPDSKFIYITPYLSEASRIKESCAAMNFSEPQHLDEYDNSKIKHTAELISKGRNIATTHQAFKNYTPETLADIRQKGYTLIIDENVDVLESYDVHPDDLQMAVDAGYIEEHDGIYSIAKPDYKGKMLSEVFSLLRSRELVRMTDENQRSLFYWALPPELLTSFKDVFVLTYLFDGQSLSHFMKIYDIPYEKIGIERTADGRYRFGALPGYTPEYVTHLKDMIHILDNDRMNQVGDDQYALSMKWFQRDSENVERLKKNIGNCFGNIWRDIPSDQRIWGSFKSASASLRGKGYSKAFVTFNTKATNVYKGKDYLVYAVNIFMNVNEKKYYHMHGIDVNEDLYALSVMVQWIWRSAIREGNEIHLYIPSKRMRTLLINWIDQVGGGGECVVR